MYEIVDHVTKLLSDLCRKNNVKLLFLITPSKDELIIKKSLSKINYSLPRKNLTNILKKNKIDLIDVYEEFKYESLNSLPIFEDGHANEKGHSIIAKNITSLYL